jgi:hypothetical protein
MIMRCVVFSTLIAPTSPRDTAVVDLLRCDTSKLYTCHRYERLAPESLTGKSAYDVTGIIGLPRASQTTSIPH